MKLILRFIFFVFACAYSLYAEAISLSKYSALNCGLENPTIEIIECDSNFYLLQLDVDHNADSTQSFNVFINQDFTGNFYYLELPLFIPVDGMVAGSFLNIEVYDEIDPNCAVEIVMILPPCSGANCNLSELQMDQIICNDSLFVAEVSFVAENPNPWGYNVLINGVYYTFQPYSNNSSIQTFTIEFNDPDLGSEILIEIFDEGDINCSVEAVFDLDCNLPCTIGYPSVTVLDCDEVSGTFAISLDFDYANVASAQFEVHGNATNYGTFAYSELPVVIDGFEGAGDMVFELIVHDAEDESCHSEYVFFGPVVCPQIIDECITFEDFELGYFDGLDSTNVPLSLGTYNDVVFSAIPHITGNPNYPVSYGILGVVDSDSNPIGPISGNVMEHESAVLQLDFFNFPLGEVQYVSFDYVTLAPGINFGLNTNFFENLDYYSSIDTTGANGFDIEIESITAGSVEFGTIVVTGNIQQILMGGSYGFIDNICFGYTSQPSCNLFDLAFEVTDCDNSGFGVALDFGYSGVSQEGFMVYNNDLNYYETFDFIDLPVSLGPFISPDSLNEYHFYVQALGVADSCVIDFAFDAPDCSSNDCSINWIEYEVVECNPLDSTFYVEFWFDQQNLLSDVVQIQGGGYNWGTFEAANQPILLGPFFSGQDIYEIVVFDVEHPDCSNFVVFENPGCGNGDCSIDWVEFDVIECDSVNGTFYLHLYVGDTQNTTSGQVEIIWGNMTFGIHNVNELLVIGPFNFGNDIYEVGFFDIQNPDCYTFIEFLEPGCGFNSACFIGDIQITDVSCNDSLFTIDIVFEFDNVGPNGVQIQGGGYNWGNFNPNIQPIQLGPFWSEDQIYEVVIYDVANPDCSSFLVFDGPCENNGGCEFIESLWVEDGPYCDSNSIYCSVAVGVNMSNQGANMLVDVHLDGNSYYNMDPYTLSNEYLEFIHFGADLSTVVICASGTDCCDTMIMEMPGMVEDFVWPGDANSDNIANNLDVLYVGLANGFDGPERDAMDIEWSAHAAPNWNSIFPISEVNIKHSDTNGDGQINAEDLEAVNENYGLTHGPVDFQPNVGTFEDPPLFVDLPTYLQPGSLVDADVELGSAQFPVDDMYGIAFTIVYPDNIFEGDSVLFEPDNSWLGVPDINMYTLHQAQTGLNEIDITLVRNDQNNASGYGRIGNFIGVIDDVLGLQQITITIKDVKAIRNDESEIPIYLPIDSTIISSNFDLPAQENIHVYPNPTDGVINIKTDKPADIISVELLNLNGVRMYWQEAYANQIQLQEFVNGVYFLRIQTQTGVYQTRIMKFD